MSRKRLRAAFGHALEWRAIAFMFDCLVTWLFVSLYKLTGSLMVFGGSPFVSNAGKTVLHAIWLHVRGMPTACCKHECVTPPSDDL